MPFRRNHRTKHSNKINPNWSGGPRYAIPYREQAPASLTEFDMLVEKRRLQNREKDWPSDPLLHLFAKQNRNSRYVPEWLLEKWGMEVKIHEGAGI